MNLRFIETFLWVARLGSFSGAADRLNTTQAAISHRVATLERELGVVLFDRDSRSVTLTAEGRRAVQKAEDIMRAAAAFRQAVSDPALIEGGISLGANDVVVHSFLPLLVERLRELYPRITIDLEVDTSANIARGLVDRKIDLALIMGPVLDDGATNIDLGAFDSSWVASPRFGLAGRRLTLSDLLPHPILTFSRGSAPHRRLQQQFRDAGLAAPSVSNVNSLVTILRLAADGFGVTALPRVVLGDHLDAGLLEELDVTPAFPPFGLHAAYLDLPGQPLVPMIAELASELAAAFTTPATDAMDTPAGADRKIL